MFLVRKADDLVEKCLKRQGAHSQEGSHAEKSAGPHSRGDEQIHALPSCC